HGRASRQAAVGRPLGRREAQASSGCSPQRSTSTYLEQRQDGLGAATAGARLLGAAEATYALVDVPGLVPYRLLVDQAVTTLRARLGHEAFAAARADGRGLRREDAIAEALTAVAGAPQVGHHMRRVTTQAPASATISA